MKTRRLATLAATTMTAVLTFAACGGSAGQPNGDASQTYRLDFGHVHTADEPFNDGFMNWAEAVNEATDGGLQIEVYPNASLGSEEDILESMTLGTNVGWNTDPARLGSYVPEWNTLYVPYLISGMDDIEKLLESEVIDEWINKLETQNQIRVLSIAWVQGYRNVFSSQPATSFAELNNMEIRSAPADMWIAAIDSFATPVDLPYGDIYNSLETGLIDGAELPYVPAAALNIQEVTDHIIETQHIYQMNAIVVSAQWFNSLPAEYQEILVEEANAAGLAASEVLASENESARQAFLDGGMTIVEHDELDIENFEAAAQSTIDRMGLQESVALIQGELN